MDAIYRQLRKRRGRAKILTSAVVTMNDDQTARLVFVRNRHKKDWLALLSTNADLAEVDVGKPFTAKMIFLIRYSYNLKSRFHRLKERGLLTAKELAAQLGVRPAVVHQLGRDGFLKGQRIENQWGRLYEPVENIIFVKGQRERIYSKHNGRFRRTLKNWHMTRMLTRGGHSGESQLNRGCLTKEDWI